MAKDKQFVFSARTTGEGLRLLNDLKKEKGVSWDDLVIDAVSAHYGLDRLAMQVPKAYKPEKKAEPKKVEPKKKGAESKHGKGGKKDLAKKVPGIVTPAEAA